MIADMLFGHEDILTTETDGVTDLFIGLGAHVVAQGVGLRLRTQKGNVWFNLPYGIDREALFSTQVVDILGDAELYPLRAAEMTTQINSIEYAKVEENAGFTFWRQGNKINVRVPCIQVDCGQRTQIVAEVTL